MTTAPEIGRKVRVLISAGEASGDMYGAALLDALRKEAMRSDHDIECFGLGGRNLRRAGCDTVVNANDVAVVGLAEVVSHLPQIYGKFHSLLHEADVRKPHVAVLIDFPDWNLRLAKQLHRRGIPVVYYVSPQLWAWRKGRLKQVKKYVSEMLVIFPFEQDFYAKHGVTVKFVGHPLAELEPEEESTALAQFGRRIDTQRIALLPGSRRKEILMNLPTMLEAAVKLKGNYEFQIPCASTIDRVWMQFTVEEMKQQVAGGTALKVVLTQDSRRTLSDARAAIVASGTATVEAAVLGTPFVMIYRVSSLTYALGRWLVDVPHFGMVNLIAGRRVVPELIQRDFTAERVVAELEPLIAKGERRQQMVRDLQEVREKLAGGATGSAADNAAKAVMDVVLSSNERS